MARKKTTPVAKAHETALRRKEALRLRLEGNNQSQVAEIMGVNVSTVSRYIAQAIRDVPRENAEELIELELQRLDEMLKGIWNDATHGDTWKIDRALSIMERRAKYLGLDNFIKPDSSKDARSALQNFLGDVKAAVEAAETTPDDEDEPDGDL